MFAQEQQYCLWLWDPPLQRMQMRTRVPKRHNSSAAMAAVKAPSQWSIMSCVSYWTPVWSAGFVVFRLSFVLGSTFCPAWTPCLHLSPLLTRLQMFATSPLSFNNSTSPQEGLHKPEACRLFCYSTVLSSFHVWEKCERKTVFIVLSVKPPCSPDPYLQGALYG